VEVVSSLFEAIENHQEEEMQRMKKDSDEMIDTVLNNLKPNLLAALSSNSLRCAPSKLMSAVLALPGGVDGALRTTEVATANQG